MNLDKAKISFAKKPVSFLPKYSSRRFGAMHFRSSCYKEDGEEALLLGKIKGMVEKELETRATKGEVLSLTEKLKNLLPDAEGKGGIPLDALRTMADEKTGVMALMTAQGLELERLKTSIATQPKDLSLRSQSAAYLEANKDIIQKIKDGTAQPLPPFELQLQTRAANVPMLPSNTYGGSAYLPKIEYIPGINDVIRPQPTFWDYLSKGATGSAALVWVNKVVPAGSGAAAFIGPGTFKPSISFGIQTEISNAKKIAASEKMATEILQDIDGFASWVEQELMYQVMQKASLTLMSGTSSSTSPAGIQTVSVPFNTTLGIKTTNPNLWDVIRACVTMLRALNFTNGNIVAFLNPIDYGNMIMTKAQNQGQLFIPPVTGATIVEDNNIPVGKIQIMMPEYFKVLIYKGFTMTYGWENDDFTKNLITVVGEMRLHQYMSNNYVGSQIYDDISAIITAITAP